MKATLTHHSNYCVHMQIKTIGVTAGEDTVADSSDLQLHHVEL